MKSAPFLASIHLKSSRKLFELQEVTSRKKGFEMVSELFVLKLVGLIILLVLVIRLDDGQITALLKDVIKQWFKARK